MVVVNSGGWVGSETGSDGNGNEATFDVIAMTAPGPSFCSSGRGFTKEASM